MNRRLCPTAVTVRASATGLAKGDHSALLAFGVAGGEELLLPVTLTVSPPLEVSPATVAESCALGTTATASVTVTNRASAPVAWSSAASASWIAAPPSSGATLASGASVTVTLTLGAGLGSAATHTGSLALADDGLASEVSASVALTTRLVSGQSTLYVGGDFSSAGGVSGTSMLARWNIASSTFGAVGSGMDDGGGGGVYNKVHALALDVARGILYVGGTFYSVGGDSGIAALAQFDIALSTWSAVGSIGNAGPGYGAYALALDAARGVLYVGGYFTSLGGDSGREYLVQWDIASSSWSALGSGVSGVVHALTLDAARGVLYVGDWDRGISQWNIASATLSALGSGTSGGSGSTLALDAARGVLFAGGSFSAAGGISGTRGLARWNIRSSTWSALGSGVSGDVNALTLNTARGVLYVGGSFSAAGGDNSTKRLAQWNIASSTWSALGSGVSSDSYSGVSAMVIRRPACAAGVVPTDASTATCTPCLPGEYVKDYGGNRRECLSCPKNTANAATLSASLAECAACAPGTGTIAAGSTTCAQCTAGTYADVAGAGCKACPAGTSSTAVGATAASTCAPCATGTAQPLSGKTSCDACALGTSTSSPGGTTCTTCPANAFTPQAGEQCYACGALQGGGWYRAATAAAGQTWGVACAKCPKGTASTAADTTTCDPCGPGTYSDVIGLELCKSCPAGTAVATNGSVALADCVSCGIGQTSAAGSGACSDCPTGTFGGAAVNPICAPCPANTFGDETRMQACKPCPPGAASPAGSLTPSACACGDPAMQSGYTGSGILECACPRGTQIEGTKCAACPLGTYSGTVGSQVCSACPVGASSQTVGATAASQCVCPSNSVLNAEATACVCVAGFEGDLNVPSGECTPCPVAKFKEVASTSLCSTCPIGTTTTSVGATTQDACVCAAGSYLNPYASANDASKCVTCELLVGGACRGGGNLTAPKLATLPGFWRAEPNSTGWYGLTDKVTRLAVSILSSSISTLSSSISLFF